MTALQDFARLSGKIYIDGRFETSRTTQFLDVIDPATEERAGGIADTTDGEVDHAIELANSARRVWMGMDSRSRAVILHDIAALLRRDKAPYAECLTREEGKPYKESVDEVSWCATAIDYYAELARHETGRLAGATVPGQFHISVKEPLGTIVIVLPFNYPPVLLCWEAAAALAAGNAVIVKPHEQTSLTTLKFMEVFATLPPGLMQVLTGGARVGQRLISSSGTHGVAYTGSVAVGQAVARTCAETFKPCLIEASGNDPFIVMPSAPLDMAVRGAAFAAYLNCGQVCTSAERFYVHEKIHDAFVEGLVAEAQKLRIGSGLGPVDMGPLATRRQRERYEGLIARAREQGAKTATGGGRPAEHNRGWFVHRPIAIPQQSQGALEARSRPSAMGANPKGVSPWGIRPGFGASAESIVSIRGRDLRKENAEFLVNLAHERNVTPRSTECDPTALEREDQHGFCHAGRHMDDQHEVLWCAASMDFQRAAASVSSGFVWCADITCNFRERMQGEPSCQRRT
jgi:betaine-aldehyde dehydrogenase